MLGLSACQAEGEEDEIGDVLMTEQYGTVTEQTEINIQLVDTFVSASSVSDTPMEDAIAAIRDGEGADMPDWDADGIAGIDDAEWEEGV